MRRFRLAVATIADFVERCDEVAFRSSLTGDGAVTNRLGRGEPGATGDDRQTGPRRRLLFPWRALVAVVRGDDAGHALPALRVCASQYGPRPITGLPHKVNGRLSPSGH